MTTTNKDFKVKNGIAVTGGGTFGGSVAVGTPTDPSHAVTKEYVDNLISSLGSLAIDAGNVEGDSFISGGGPATTVWDATLDGGTV